MTGACIIIASIFIASSLDGVRDAIRELAKAMKDK
jgi:hypothetical protein